MTDTMTPQIDPTKLAELGQVLFRSFGQYETDRRMIEERWLKNLRAIRKIYDPEVLALIPADRSRAYPGLTQFMVRGTIARLMQLLWPMTEKNYSVKESPLPSLSQEQLQSVLDQLVQSKAGEGGDITQVTLTDDEIEKAILNFAKGKAERMEVKITDDLQEMDILTLARRVVKSAVSYNIGILRGPLHTKFSARTWQRDNNTGKYNAVEQIAYKPLFEFLPVWDHYPDLTAVSLDKQDGCYDRHVMTRVEVEALAQRPDFMADRINEFLRDHPDGSYKSKWWEEMIKAEPKSGQAPVAGKPSRKYEVLSYWGYVTGAQLAAAGNVVPEADLTKSFKVNSWMLETTVIKCRLAPFGEDANTHHYFVFEEDDLSILGNGQPDALRDSQVSLCETARAMHDNMSVIGPMVEVNDDLLTPGQDTSIRKHKTWRREGEGASSQFPAVRDISISSHLTELQAMFSMYMDLGAKESGLPPPSMGDVSGAGSEALRTSKNASMFLGAAALPIRDTVRNYDTFTVSFIKALVKWNEKYAPNPTRDGDHDIIARGSTSLIAKEVLGSALNEFRASVTPDEVPHLRTRNMLKLRMKAVDLPVDELLEDEDVANQIIDRNAQAQAAQTAQQSKLIDAQVTDMLAKAQANLAKAEGEGAKQGIAILQTLIDAVAQGNKASNDADANAVALHAVNTKPAKAAA